MAHDTCLRRSSAVSRSMPPEPRMDGDTALQTQMVLIRRSKINVLWLTCKQYRSKPRLAATAAAIRTQHVLIQSLPTITSRGCHKHIINTSKQLDNNTSLFKRIMYLNL